MRVDLLARDLKSFIGPILDTATAPLLSIGSGHVSFKVVRNFFRTAAQRGHDINVPY